MKEVINEKLSKLPFFSQFRFIKSREIFLLKEKDVSYIIGLQGRKCYCIEEAEFGVEYSLTFSIRYDVVHLWFAKHSIKSSSNRKYYPTIMCFPYSLTGDDNYGEFCPPLTASNLEKFSNCIEENYRTMIRRFPTLKAIYNYSVLPLFDDPGKRDKNGAEWLFDSLAMARIVSPGEYSKLKNKAVPYFMDLCKDDDPNMVPYENRLLDILSDLESQDFSSFDIYS